MTEREQLDGELAEKEYWADSAPNRKGKTMKYRYEVRYGVRDIKSVNRYFTLYHADQFLRAMILNGTPAELVTL